MHGRIFQIASRPIKKDDYKTPDDFYDNSSNFADYIGDDMVAEFKKEDVKHLAETLSDLFELDKTGMVLVYKGGIDAFKKEWADAIHESASQVTAESIMRSKFRDNLELLCTETHKNSIARFYIEEYNGSAGPMSDLIEYVNGYMKPGDKLYIGAVIDYHL